MDQWEGQQFNRSPGNLYSEVKSVKLNPSSGYTIKLSLDKVIPPVKVPEDTKWVKHIKIQSKRLTEFWGHPIYLGAIVLLPKGYDTHPDVFYPVHYRQGHFSLRPPFPMLKNIFGLSESHMPGFFQAAPQEDGKPWPYRCSIPIFSEGHGVFSLTQ
jgi:hypothetical protein